MALITQQQLTNASTDADSLSAFVNNASGTITTRLGRVVKCLAQFQADIAAAIAGLGVTFDCAFRINKSSGAIAAQKGIVTVSFVSKATGYYTVSIPGLGSTPIISITANYNGGGFSWGVSGSNLWVTTHTSGGAAADSEGDVNVVVYQR